MRIHKPHLFDRHHAADAGDENGNGGDAPLPGYDRMDERELVAELRHHTQAELAEIEDYERAHESRTRVLNKLHYLRQTEPLPNYDQLSSEEIEKALETADVATIDSVRAYERKFRDRPRVFEAIDTYRPKAVAKEPPARPRTVYQHTEYGPSLAPDELGGNKSLVTSLYAEAINGRDLDAIDRLLSEQFIHNGHRRARKAQKEEFGHLLTAFPDLQTEIELILAEGDLVAVHQRWTGTHEGEMGGVEHGERIEFTSTAVIRIRDGLIAEAWDEVDLDGIADLYMTSG